MADSTIAVGAKFPKVTLDESTPATKVDTVELLAGKKGELAMDDVSCFANALTQ